MAAYINYKCSADIFTVYRRIIPQHWSVCNFYIIVLMPKEDSVEYVAMWTLLRINNSTGLQALPHPELLVGSQQIITS